MVLDGLASEVIQVFVCTREFLEEPLSAFVSYCGATVTSWVPRRGSRAQSDDELLPQVMPQSLEPWSWHVL